MSEAGKEVGIHWKKVSLGSYHSYWQMTPEIPDYLSSLRDAFI